MKIYLVKMNYDDGREYESMAHDYIFTAFSKKEKAEEFCKNNSDEYDEEYNEYKILTERNIIDPVTGYSVNVCPSVNDYDSEFGDFYWFTIEELEVID